MPPPTLSGDADDAIDAEPFQREDGADDVDDGVERADFVKVHLADGHLVDGGLRFAKTLKQRLRPVAADAADNAERSMSAKISDRVRCGCAFSRSWECE